MLEGCGIYSNVRFKLNANVLLVGLRISQNKLAKYRPLDYYLTRTVQCRHAEEQRMPLKTVNLSIYSIHL